MCVWGAWGGGLTQSLLSEYAAQGQALSMPIPMPAHGVCYLGWVANARTLIFNLASQASYRDRVCKSIGSFVLRSMLQSDLGMQRAVLQHTKYTYHLET